MKSLQELKDIQAAKQSTLSGAGCSDDCNDLALMYNQIAAVQRFDRAVIILFFYIYATDKLSVCRHDASSFLLLR